MTFKHQISHKPGPGYARELATGMVAQGLQDGMLHLTFYRDASTVTSENFSADQAPAPGQKAIELKPDNPPVTSDAFREDVFTVMMPMAVAAQVAAVLNAIPEAVAQQQAAQNASAPAKPQ